MEEILIVIMVQIAFGLAIISIMLMLFFALIREIRDLPKGFFERFKESGKLIKEILGSNPSGPGGNNPGHNSGDNPGNNPSNNPSNERKNELLEKLDKKEINYDECVELAKILKEEIDEATKRGDILTVILSSGVIIYVGMVLKELSKEHSSSKT